MVIKSYFNSHFPLNKIVRQQTLKIFCPLPSDYSRYLERVQYTIQLFVARQDLNTGNGIIKRATDFAVCHSLPSQIPRYFTMCASLGLAQMQERRRASSRRNWARVVPPTAS